MLAGPEDGSYEFVLLSDVHLTEIVDDGPEGWWRFKSSRSSQDDALVGFLEALEARRPRNFEATWVIFNGDTLDFDSVYSSPPGHKTPLEGLGFSVSGSVFKMRRLLADHLRFFAGLARFLARGNRVTFVMGNHDRELAFGEVQELLRELVAGSAPAGCSVEVAEAIDFEPWFFYVPDLLYAEHGQQYDGTCSYRDVLHPFVDDQDGRSVEIEVSLGSVASRMAVARAGTFNPFDDSSFLRGFWGYVQHAARYYWPRRRYFSMYGEVAVRAYIDLRSRRRRALKRPSDPEPRYEAYAERKGVDRSFVQILRRLASPPVADRAFSLLHEIWLDRLVVLMSVIGLLVVGIMEASAWYHWALLLSLAPVLALALRGVGRGSLALLERGRWGLVAEHVSTALDVPVIAFGHSHRPERRPLRNGGRYYNLGTWAPLVDPDQESDLSRARRYLRVRRDQDGRVHVAFQRWPDRDASSS